MAVESGSKGIEALARTEPRLQVWRTVVQAYALTFSSLGYLLRISWAWVLLMTPLSLAFYACTLWLGWHNSASYFAPLEDIISTLLFQPFLASIAVAWHRRLLANEIWPKPVYLRLDGVVGRYFGLSLVISVLSQGPIILLGIAASSGVESGWNVLLVLAVVLTTGAGLFLGTRIWLALPAQALGNSEITVRQAWRGSRRNFWRLIAGFVLSGLPTAVLLVLAAAFGPDLDQVGQPLIYAAWQTLFEIGITFLAGMLIVSFLSLAYRRLIRDRDPADLLGRRD
jgi:hypothetical protein